MSIVGNTGQRGGAVAVGPDGRTSVSELNCPRWTSDPDAGGTLVDDDLAGGR